jgi:hypothetical protein
MITVTNIRDVQSTTANYIIKVKAFGRTGVAADTRFISTLLQAILNWFS